MAGCLRISTYIWIFLSCSSFVGAATAPSLDKLANHLMRMELSQAQVPEEPEFQFFELEEGSKLIGIKQSFRIHAPIKKVATLLENTKEFRDLFNDLKDVQITKIKNKNNYSIATETALPIPFVPNDHTILHYVLKRKKERILYRVSLDQSSSLVAFNGLIFLGALQGGDCLFYKIDFFEPNRGLVRILGQDKIWRESAVAALQADKAIKFHLEHPNWDLRKVHRASNENLDSSRLAYHELYDSRLRFAESKALPTIMESKKKISSR